MRLAYTPTGGLFAKKRTEGGYEGYFDKKAKKRR
jgi:hypothetical protein